MNKSHFILYSNCLPVLGAKRSIVADLGRNRYKYIPNLLYDILLLTYDNTVEEIKTKYANEQDEGIDAYFSHLAQNDWGFYTNSPYSFPKLNLDWDSPSHITNFIIDIEESTTYSIKNVISQLSQFKCEALQIRIFTKLTQDRLIEIGEIIKTSSLMYVEIIGGYNPSIPNTFFYTFFEDPRVRSITLHSAPSTELVNLPNPIGKQILFFSNEIIDSDSHCGIINEKYFSAHISSFLEAINYNSCLNRKLSINSCGDIKNCPSMPTVLGNIHTDTIADVINQGKLTEFWQINKNQITTCKDCEFRYICTDCRAFLKEPDNIFSKPLKCQYNPYEARWEY
jgi:SPASM domain peptide maturase of grasp-with-spasm system